MQISPFLGSRRIESHTTRFFCVFFSKCYHSTMDESSVQCPTCGEYFSVVGPSWEELPAEWDYDCEICCRPMILVFDESGGYARGLGE